LFLQEQFIGFTAKGGVVIMDKNLQPLHMQTIPNMHMIYDAIQIGHNKLMVIGNGEALSIIKVRG
jgi:hypothetical protein